MKNKLKAPICGLCILCASAFSLEAQVSSLNLQSFTNQPTVLTNGTAAATTSGGFATNNIFALTRDCDLAFAAQFYQTNGFNYTNGAVSVGGSFSIDTTNFGLSPFTLSCSGSLISSNGMAALSSSNVPPVSLSTNWNHTQIAGYTAVEFYGYTNSSTNCQVFIPPGGLKINRPTVNTQTF